MNQKRALIEECKSKENKVVTLKGWVKRIRHLGSVSFLLLRDRTGVIQCVLENEWAGFKAETESVVQITGKIVATSKTETGVEMIAEHIQILNSAAPLPFEMNKKTLSAGLEHILNHRVLSLRHERANAVFKIKSAFAEAFSNYLSGQGFTRIFTPKIVSQGAEGGANVFWFNYFGQKAYLAQSPQFYKQMMVAAGFERVFEVAAVYRAEEHNSSRHLNEYISLDAEIGFIENFHELMEMETNLLQHMFQTVSLHFHEELKLFNAEVPGIKEIPKLTLQEAQEILQRTYKKVSPSGDLDTEGEKLIGKYIKESFGSDFVFITHYPKETRPMYTMPSSHNPALTESFDLLYKGLEITSGGQRIHEYEQLLASFKSKGLDPENFKSYLHSFQYGFPPHGGFAIGLERLVFKFLNLMNVREASAFPRDCGRITP
ncbi:aspartate--tRNA(Asn) ligase [Ectobacillus panaciterrae]|uniref:aspartate--tRNA(Asn) ligase n=1 Tax=Ectobacillus panaciterrae TaxID=363872 RepID=UPI0004275229|nr:aspartate--tRNA(Asn) ligase [Ectobacillus panaciterrae]